LGLARTGRALGHDAWEVVRPGDELREVPPQDGPRGSKHQSPLETEWVAASHGDLQMQKGPGSIPTLFAAISLLMIGPREGRVVIVGFGAPEPIMQFCRCTSPFDGRQGPTAGCNTDQRTANHGFGTRFHGLTSLRRAEFPMNRARD
jgi:hypothetical protein